MVRLFTQIHGRLFSRIYRNKNDKQILNKVRDLMDDTFQYVKSIYVRWRIWGTYVSPVLEWYIPA